MKVKILTKALAQIEGYEDVEVYDDETGEYCGDDREYYMYNADSFPLGHIVDGDCQEFESAEFCREAIHPLVDKANFYFIQKCDGLWAVADLDVNADVLTPELKQELTDNVHGQFTDGWGEGFEQNPYRYDGEQYYISVNHDELKPRKFIVEVE